MEPAEPINLHDYEALAQARLDPAAWAYYSSGVDDEVTLRANRAGFEKLQLLPRMLSGVSSADLRTTVLGTPVSMPILVAPTALQGLACPDADCATARAAGSVGTLMTAATESTRTLEEIAAVATGPLWFQLYVYRTRHIAEDIVRRVERAGYSALVLTVDAPRWGRIGRSLRVGRAIAPDMVLANFEAPGYADLQPAALSWDDLEWLRSLTDLPLILKGLLTPEDAAMAVEHDVAGIIVSNHGARALDGVPSSIEALPAVVEAVGGRIEVYMDGGVRRGTDVLKALALGARAVMIGRPVLWGLAVNGAEGVEHVLRLLRDELEHAMVLAGRQDIGSLDPSLVRVS